MSPDLGRYSGMTDDQVMDALDESDDGATAKTELRARLHAAEKEIALTHAALHRLEDQLAEIRRVAAA